MAETIFTKLKSILYNKYFIVFFICILLSGLAGIFFIQLPDFDFFSYHYHIGWAFLDKRYDIDFMPCQARSYYNPILDVINFLLIKYLNQHPFVFLFISNIKYGIFIFLTYLISDLVFKNNNLKNIEIASVVFLVILSPILILCMRMDFNDLQISNLILISIFILLKYIFEPASLKKKLMFFLSAFILGIAIGLKLAMITFTIPMLISVLIYLKKDPDYFKNIGLMFAGGFLGFVITEGWWMLIVFEHFKNPLFPYYNNIFKSPMADIINFTQAEFAHLKPESFFAYIFSPFMNSAAHKYAGLESTYYDSKIPICAICILFIIFIQKFKTLRNAIQNIINPDILMILAIFTAFGYYINQWMFGSVRYLLALVVLCSLIIVTFCMTFKMSYKNLKLYPLLIFILLWVPLTMTNVESDTARKDKIKTIIKVPAPKILDNSIILCGNQRACFSSPHLNKNVKYVAFTVPEDVSKLYPLYFDENTPYKNYYYHSEYLEKLLLKIFDEEKNIYIMFHQYGFGNDAKVYFKSLQYYSKNKIKKVSNCAGIKYTVLSEDYQAFICKIK